MRGAVLLALALPGCATLAGASEHTVLSVGELRTVIDARTAEGTEVIVRGTVSRGCYSLGCALHANSEGMGLPSVSLAGGTTVEPALRAAAGKTLTLRAQIAENSCTTIVCPPPIDRHPDIIPIEIID